MRRLVSVVFAAAALSIAGAPRVFCADVVGLVADTHGRPIANARILVKTLANNALSEAHSNTNGQYQLTGLAPGTYKYVLDLVASGFVGGDAVSYLGAKGLTINWHLSRNSPAIALARESTGTMLAGDPPAADPPVFTDEEFLGLLVGSGALIIGGVTGGLAAAGEYSEGGPASPSL